MNYQIIFDNRATSEIDFIKKSGDKATLKKLERILSELQTHPTVGIGNPEMLKHLLSGF